MSITNDRRRAPSTAINTTLVLHLFLLIVAIVVGVNSIVVQTYGLNASNDSMSNDQSTTSPNNNDNSIKYTSNNKSSPPDITCMQQVPDYTNNTNSSAYLNYEDQADGISLMYPSNWQKIEYPSGAMSYGEGHRIIASFLAPLDPSDQWRSSLNIQISNLSDLKNIIPKNASSTTINLAGHSASKLEYTNTERMYLNRDLSSSNSIKLKVMQVWTTIGDNTYVLNYSAEASKYQQYLPIIQKMLNSFRVS